MRCINCEKVLNRKQKYCSNKCQKDFEYKSYIERWLLKKEKGWIGRSRQLSRHVRKYILTKYNFSCAECGWNKIHPVDGSILVEIDHIDGNAENCLEDNLRVLCPNCHSMTATFRARNKNSKRIR